MSEREAWLLLVNATTMRGDASAYPDPLDAMARACRDRAFALDVLRGLGVDVGLIQDPHGLWPSEGQARKWAQSAT